VAINPPAMPPVMKTETFSLAGTGCGMLRSLEIV
jgi:hypothetical protein